MASPIMQVLVDGPFDSPLDYVAPLHHSSPAIGVRCIVPLGRRKALGLIAGVSPTSAIEPLRIKRVERLLDEVSALDEHWLAFTRFAADYYQHGWGEVAIPALPPALRQLPGPRHARALERLRQAPLGTAGSPTRGAELNEEQRAALAGIANDEGFTANLLFGVTGSGKTEVYLASIERVLAVRRDAQALLLVPEINLTPQLEARVRSHFPGETVMAMHSGLAAAERTRAWLAAHEGRARVIIGTRLAIFASLPRLAVIVVDEEHDPSYKAGEGVRYSARDLAVKRAQMLRIPVVLGSATPSLETWSHARSGRYRLLRLTRRISNEFPQPRIELVEPKSEATSGIAAAIENAIGDGLGRGEQSLVFLNRRGYATVVACDACGWLSHCPHCAAYAVFHKPDGALHCHHCGWTQPVPRTCPTCGNSALRGVGRGTQRIEEWVRERWPQARVARVDRDTARRRNAASNALDAVHRGEVDVLVGTQMIAKGHDFRRIALVVVLNADGQLMAQDFRASERLFATLVQVIGRAGRSGGASRALVQTRYPAHPLFAALAGLDYAAFADALLAERERAAMPPYSHQALLTAEAARLGDALAFLRNAAELAAAASAVRVFDPVPMTLARRAGIERAQLLVEAAQRPPLHRFLRAWLARLRELKARVRWNIEVDPAEI
ncbi:MAG TPA: primosomal protein N' [Burkholderiaceae bacterium]|nr:primosomal protein N' [Burkholderiaceae bacterium]